MTRAMMHAGQRIEPGRTLRVPASMAAMLLDSGRCELAHEGDADEVLAAKRADTKRAIAQAGRPWHGPQVSEPWQRIA
ncbi:MAG: hypothetical protein ACLGIT_11605 [Gammaproteobacteria bacterium]